MEQSRTLDPRTEIAESLSPLEFDAESESFRATYDSTRDSTSLAVVATVGTALGRDPLELAPLHSVVDTDALEELTTGGSTDLGNHHDVSFAYEGFEITVTGEGVVEADPIETT